MKLPTLPTETNFYSKRLYALLLNESTQLLLIVNERLLLYSILGTKMMQLEPELYLVPMKLPGKQSHAPTNMLLWWWKVLKAQGMFKIKGIFRMCLCAFFMPDFFCIFLHKHPKLLLSPASVRKSEETCKPHPWIKTDLLKATTWPP